MTRRGDWWDRREPALGCALAIVASACAWAGVVALVVALSGCTPVPQPLDEARARALQPVDLTPALAVRAQAEATYTHEQRASVHVRPMPGLPDVVGGLPIVVPPGRRPVVGRRWSVGWVTRPVADKKGRRPDRAAALLVTLRPPGPPQPVPGGRGVMLQVPPDYVLTPTRVDELSDPSGPFAFEQDGDGRIRLSLWLPQQLFGLSAWMQLLVADERVAAGCVSTPVVELHVGSR